MPVTAPLRTTIPVQNGARLSWDWSINSLQYLEFRRLLSWHFSATSLSLLRWVCSGYPLFLLAFPSFSLFPYHIDPASPNRELKPRHEADFFWNRQSGLSD